MSLSKLAQGELARFAEIKVVVKPLGQLTEDERAQFILVHPELQQFFLTPSNDLATAVEEFKKKRSKDRKKNGKNEKKQSDEARTASLYLIFHQQIEASVKDISHWQGKQLPLLVDEGQRILDNMQLNQVHSVCYDFVRFVD